MLITIYCKMFYNLNFLIIIFSCGLISSCNYQGNSDKVRTELIIKDIGTNAYELEKVISHYADDDAKLRAAYFLIANMPGKGFYQYHAFDVNGKLVNFENYCDSSNLSIVEAKKKYEDSTKTHLKFVKGEFIADIDHISSTFLIENIDYAFKTWRLPLARHLNFDQFKELILPYRVNAEPLHFWRKDFYDRLISLRNSLSDKKVNRFHAAALVNDSLIKIYWYRNDVINFYKGHLSLQQIELLKGGRCEDLNVLLGYWLRTIGVPVASEFTPFWANSSGGHSWLGVMNEQNRFAVMNSLYDNPILDYLPFDGERPAKVYRSTFKINEEMFNAYIKNHVIPKSDYLDVTDKYLSVSDLDLQLKEKPSKSCKIYLSVLNGKYWKPLQNSSKQYSNHVIFKNVVREALYITFKTTSHDLPIEMYDAFFLSEKGIVYNFNTDTAHMINVKFNIFLSIYDMKEDVFNQVCKLYYWDSKQKEWTIAKCTGKLLKSSTSLSNKAVPGDITFEHIPGKTLYRIATMSGNYISRPIIYNPEKHRYMTY
jgi:hypothetical protein